MKPLPLHIEPEDTNPFDLWFNEDRGSGMDYEIELDVNECVQDLDFNDVDLY